MGIDFNRFVEVSVKGGANGINSILHNLKQSGSCSSRKELKPCISTESELLYQSTQMNSQDCIDPDNTPLHNSLLKQSSCANPLNTKKILRLISDHPEYTDIPNSTGELPLHYACFTNSSFEIIVSLIEMYPDAVRKCNSERMLPLHFACLVGAPCLKTIQLLLRQYTKGIFIQSELTVNYHALNTKSAKSKKRNVQEEDLIDEWPQSSDDLGEDGCCILENIFNNVLACGDVRNFNYDDNDSILKAEVGWTPLHLAVVNEARVEVIDELLKAGHGSVDLQTSQGRSALDCAILIVDFLNETGSSQRSLIERRRNMRKIVMLLQEYDVHCNSNEFY